MNTPRSRAVSVAAGLAGAVAVSFGLLAGCASDGDASARGSTLQRAEASPDRTPHFDRAGMMTFERGGQLWIFDPSGDELAAFVENPATASTSYAFVGDGPNGRTIRSDDRDALLAYVAAKPGFRVAAREGDVFVFREGSSALGAWRAGRLDEAATEASPGAGPKGATLRGEDRSVLLAYLATKPGFAAFVDDDERVWVFEEGSEALATYLAHGEPAESVTWIGEGPLGTTIRSGDRETLVRHRATVPGFRVFMGEDGRLWVFRENSDAIAEYESAGDLGRNYSRIGEGPDGRTVRSEDEATVDAYLAVVNDG